MDSIKTVKGFDLNKSPYAVNVYSPTLAIVFALFSNISSTFFERPLDLASSIGSASLI